jgi:hypothetical protein
MLLVEKSVEKGLKLSVVLGGGFVGDSSNDIQFAGLLLRLREVGC